MQGNDLIGAAVVIVWALTLGGLLWAEGGLGELLILCGIPIAGAAVVLAVEALFKRLRPA